ncbi:MAG: type II toxin-antitoxin system Phd/YefM family antitoxin [Cyanobacteria bacterium J06555_13]
MTPTTIQLPIPITVLVEAFKALSIEDKALLKKLLDNEIIETRQPENLSDRHPLRGLPLTIVEDFDEPMPELWDALSE